MPCYNAGKTLPHALESVLCQTFTDFELVVVDDGSGDDTLEILHDFASRDRRMRILQQEHGGIISALNKGIQASRGGLICRMDADDISFPERIKAQVDYLDTHPDCAVVSCLVEGFPRGEVRQGFKIYMAWLNRLITHEQITREIFIESPLPHPSVMMRKSWLERVGGYQERGWAEDYDLWLRLYLAGAKFSKVPQVLLSWREHPMRLTRVDSRYSVENFLRCKAYYLAQGPLKHRDAVFLWGAGMVGRRISKHLQRQGVPLVAFLDIDPNKIGRTKRGLPILAAEELPARWEKYQHPALLAAVGSRGARELIRQRLVSWGLQEGLDWWAVA